jgi:hypothetical protein
MKLNNLVENILSRQFQHCLESRLTGMNKMDVHQISFVSSEKAIQTKSTKAISPMKNIPSPELQHRIE